jgi:micrococcal nuclease
MFEYKATVEEIIDGDTIDVLIDLGFRVSSHQRIRLVGVDTPEIHSSDPDKRAKAQAAKAFTTAWVESHEGRVIVKSQKPGGGDKYGRWLATVYPPGATTEPALNVSLISAGHAIAYGGGTRP